MGEVKIISGKYKRKTIMTPGEGTHPMGERERNALFNMIGSYIKGAVVMDLYAGSGALGIEAISRGASEVLFVEESHVAMSTIVDNCMGLRIPEQRVAFYRGSASAFYKKFNNPSAYCVDPMMAAAFESFPDEYDIILADPPYDDFNQKEISRIAKFLKEGGILALSHPGEAPDFPWATLQTTTEHAAAHLSLYVKD